MSEIVPISLTNALHNVLPILGLVNSAKNAERTLHQIIEQMVQDFNCLTCAVLVIDQVREILTIKIFHGLSWHFYKSYQKGLDVPILREFIWRGDPLYVNDRDHNPVISEALKLENDFASCYAIPITVNQRPMGYLYMDSDEVDNFYGDRQMLAQVYAHLIGMTLYREELTESVSRLSTIDEESGAIKYSHFFCRFQEQFQQAERLHDPLSVLLLDMQGYGGMVKTYGTETMNQLLQGLVAAIQSNLRRYDGLGRFATDKFLVSLPGTRMHEARKAGEKILKVLTGQTFSAAELKVNFFVGLANYPENCSSLDGLMTATKNALLEAKRSNHINEMVILKQIVD